MACGCQTLGSIFHKELLIDNGFFSIIYIINALA